MRYQVLPPILGLGPPGRSASKRIDDEGQRFQIELDLFDRLGSRKLVDRRYGENRLALIQRLVGQTAFPELVGMNHLPIVIEAVGGSRKIFLGQDGLHAGHGQRFAGIDVADTRVRHRAEQ